MSEKGLFIAGGTGGPGRPKGSRNRRTIMKEHLRSDWNRVAAAFVGHDLEAGRRWAENVMHDNMSKARDQAFDFDLGGLETLADVLGAQYAVMIAVADREIRTGHAQNLLRRLERHREKLSRQTSA
ncbi:MAG: hypothetical protein KIT25_10135 [Enhydrobacter sp.]|nr:MAG: hypothetical protein KIT25_10135 [Enhydrobacter sp.]